MFFPALYLAVYCYCLYTATSYVHSVPWSDYRIANLMVRLHVRPLPQRSPVCCQGSAPCEAVQAAGRQPIVPGCIPGCIAHACCQRGLQEQPLLRCSGPQP